MAVRFWVFLEVEPTKFGIQWILAMREKREVKNDSKLFGWSSYVNDGAIS